MRRILKGAVLAGLLAPAPAGAMPTSDTGCADLVRQYDEDLKTAQSLISSMVEQALNSANPSGVLGQLGLQGQSLSPEQAIRRGALSAMPPPSQNAAIIYLLRANTTMQAMMWKNCQPPGGGGGGRSGGGGG